MGEPFSNFGHIGGFSSMSDPLTVMPQHLNRIEVQALTKPLQNFNLVFIEPFRSGLACVFNVGDNQDVYWQMRDEPLCYLSQQ